MFLKKISKHDSQDGLGATAPLMLELWRPDLIWGYQTCMKLF